MKTYRIAFWGLLFFLFWHALSAQDTFSIVAVDSTTGEVGSAGATCLDVNQEGVSAVIISDLLPGRGAIHTQSFWLAGNQIAARQRMESGESPSEILDWLQANDAGGNPQLRQYGIADLAANGEPRSDAFTGAECFDVKGQRVGRYYAIQGNILLSESVLDSMEARFLALPGEPLPVRLMAALQGANLPGADKRCLDEGVSSRSAFLRVARPGDSPIDPYLDLRVDSTALGVEPIDELQKQFDQWLITSAAHRPVEKSPLTVELFPNPTSSEYQLRASRRVRGEAVLWSAEGREVGRYPLRGRKLVLASPASPGLYWMVLYDEAGRILATRKLVVSP